VLQYQILPLLEDRRCRVPVEGVLKDHDVVLEEQLLLSVHVDVQLRICLVEIVDGDTVETPNGVDEPSIAP
jgi:hypothetical protein